MSVVMTTAAHLQVNGELSEGKHGGIAHVNVVIRHSVIDVLQQRL